MTTGPGRGRRASIGVSPTALGITLMGVILSIGVSVAFGVQADWWARLLLGAGTILVLGAAVKVLTRGGRGPVAQVAEWLVGGADADQDSPDR